MSLLPEATYSHPSEATPLLEPQHQPLFQHQFDAVVQSATMQQSYMMAPPSALPSTIFHPSHSSIPSTSSPITPSLLSPSSLITSAGPLKRRRFSGAKIQPTRIKKVMQSDEDIGRMVASVPVAVGRAMEHFAEKFLLAAAQVVSNTGARTLAPHHLKLAMLANPHFAFLEPILREVGVPSRAGEAYQYPQQATVSQQPLQSVKIDDMCGIGSVSNPLLDSTSIMQSAIPSIMSTQLNPYAVHNPYFMHQLQQDEPYDSLTTMGQMGQLMAGVGTQIPYQSSPLTSPIVVPTLTSSSGTIPSIPRSVRRSSSVVSNGEGEGGAKRPRGRPRKNKKEKCVEDDLVVDSDMADNGVLKPPSPGDIKTECNEADRLLMPPPPLLPMKQPH